jgi:phosphoglycolate phosphatase-like HAD superfamily hydrolase
MNKITSLLIILFLISACGVKQTRQELSSGNYDEAIAIATDNLRNNKDAKRKQDYIVMLEEAFAKAKERDLAEINLWVKDANPQNLEKIFETYRQLNNRQEKIKPLLPLKLIKENRQAKFALEDYSDQIVSSKNALSKYLYDNTQKLLKNPDKMIVRRAYDDLVYLDQINPNYKDVSKLIDEAKFKGTDFVIVSTKNETEMVIPARLQADLLDFSTYGLNDKWTAYHSARQKNISYDYGMIVGFRQINISPEQVKEKEFYKEKQVKVGSKKLIDRQGNVVKDSLGHAVMVDDIRLMKATVFEFRQFKACQVTAKADYVDLKNNQLIETFPIASEFVFENIYSRFKGDKRAVDEAYFQYFDRRAVPFPSNEQMVFDTGEDLKAKLKNIIVNNRFRK